MQLNELYCRVVPERRRVRLAESEFGRRVRLVGRTRSLGAAGPSIRRVRVLRIRVGAAEIVALAASVCCGLVLLRLLHRCRFGLTKNHSNI